MESLFDNVLNLPEKLGQFTRDSGLLSLRLITDHVKIIPQVFGDPSPAPESEFGYLASTSALPYYLRAALPGAFFSERTRLQATETDHLPFDNLVKEDDVAWFYMNGIMTDRTLAILNQLRLIQIFRRPIALVHNPTLSLLEDLFRSTWGRAFGRESEPVDVLEHTLAHALEKNKRVVFIGHSYGCTVFANAIRRLLRRDLSLANLEAYLFATPTDQLEVREGNAPAVIEHFANEWDFFARFGVLYERNAFQLPGTIYLRRGQHGHFLNAHYLDQFDRNNRTAPYVAVDMESNLDLPEVKPRLFAYIDGNRP